MMLALATIALVIALGAFGMLVEGHLATPDLDTHPPLGDGTTAPSVSIIVAARDEARSVEAAVRSLLAQRYGPLEVVVVDDRSTDDTGAILDRLAVSDARLRVVHVDELPRGWLGKTHALARGAESASGELFLFSDADVMLEPLAISRAVAMLEERRVDHLAVGPRMISPTLPLALVVNFFVMSFMLFQRPWRSADPGSRDHVGIGAFNLVRRSTYFQAGGHERVRLRPDDDIKLGKAIKQSGGRQLFAGARQSVTVEWYRSLPEMAAGLRKNVYAGMEYRAWAAIGATLATLYLHIMPFVMVSVSDGLARLVWIATCLALIGAYAYSAARHRSRPWLAILFPVAALIFAWIFVRNVVLTIVDGSIEWRGTRYSLEELRQNVV